MKRIEVIVRDIKTFSHCKPKVLDFTIEGAPEDLRVVLDALRQKFLAPQYGFNLRSEETIYHPLNPDLTIATA